MKQLLFLIGFTISTVPLHAQQHNWGMGLRTGAFTQGAAFTAKKDQYQQNRDLRSGFYFQAFVNKQFGSKQRWMLEGNLGYNSFSYEWVSLYSGFASTGNDYYYAFSKTHVYSLQANLRYAFWQLPELKWKHYAGISIAGHKNVEYTTRSYSRNSDFTKSGVIFRYIFAGAEYFGKIQMNKRLSVQYLFGYNIAPDQFVSEGRDIEDKPYRYLYNGPTIHRFNFNFGLGYQL